MKKLLFIVLTILAGCQSYEDYVDVYGQPEHFSDNIGYYMEYPEEFITDFLLY